LNLALIPKLGLMGAGVARLTSSTIISLYFWLQFRGVSRVSWLRYLYKPALASALMAAVMVFVGHSWILRMALGTAVYGGMILLISPSERTEVLRIANAILTPSQSTNLAVAGVTGKIFQGPEETLPTEVVKT